MESNQKSDAEIVELYKSTTDSRYLGELFSRYSHLVLGTCLKFLKHEEDARDAVNDIFVSLMTKLIDHEVSHFKSWLYSVSCNHCRQILRKNKGSFEVDIDDEKYSESIMEKPDFEHLNNEKEELEDRLGDCIESLKEEQKFCVTLFYLEKKRYKEIADLTGFDLNKVKSYIQNGKANLQKCMGV
ncbi:MAG: sigma-70 family RNA polymerase sigma factor [Bacteroidia bacterium]|nr:sigma-70 family RNA polymerase sigma factor [Bacteroidia bacterium]